MVEFYSGKFSDLKEDGLLRQGKNWNKKIFMCTSDYEFKNVSNFFSKRCKSLIARNDKFFKWIIVKVWSVIKGKYSTCLVHLFTVTMVIVLSRKYVMCHDKKRTCENYAKDSLYLIKILVKMDRQWQRAWKWGYVACNWKISHCQWIKRHFQNENEKALSLLSRDFYEYYL